MRVLAIRRLAVPVEVMKISKGVVKSVFQTPTAKVDMESYPDWYYKPLSIQSLDTLNDWSRFPPDL
jgi:hypothetical protein